MSLEIYVLIFLAATLVIAVAGTKLTQRADQLADLTGWGEAIFGAIMLGMTTSLPGIITTVTAAWENHPVLASNNALGGIAAQTLFLAIADLTYRRANLEHAAASLPNLMQGGLLMGLLSFLMLGMVGPEFTLGHIHPFSLLLLLFYLAGSRLIARAQSRPMWSPRQTDETRSDEPADDHVHHLSLRQVSIQFALLALVVAVAGYAIGKSGLAIADQTGLSEGLVGSLFTAVSSSLPELIVCIAAVRRGALTLAVSNIIGGNSFDVLFMAFADVAFLKGSILHQAGPQSIFIIALTLVMTAILILGLLHRQEKGLGTIGWESTLIIGIYLLGNGLWYLLA